MNWDAVAAVAQLLGSLGVIATLVYLAVQIRQNSTLLTSSLADSTRDAQSELTRLLASDREALRVFWAGLNDRSSLTELDRLQFDALLSLWLLTARQFFDQGKPDAGGLQWMLCNPNVLEWWATYSSTFLQSDRDYINRTINDLSLAQQKNASADAVAK
jgi:hypothetical protein